MGAAGAGDGFSGGDDLARVAVAGQPSACLFRGWPTLGARAAPGIARRPAMSLVLLPGLDGTARLFNGFVRQLGREAAVIPCGLPERQAQTFDELTHWAVNQLPPGRSVILGESFSAAVAVRVAAAVPDRVAALILTAPFDQPPVPALAAPFLRLLAPFAVSFSPPAGAIRALLTGPDASAELVAEVEDAIDVPSAWALAARLRELTRARIPDATIEGVRAPTLILAGTRDQLVRPAHFARLATKAKVVQIDGPHLLLQVRPRPCAEAILRFLDEVGQRPALRHLESGRTLIRGAPVTRMG